jgi:hypothetical protein
MSEFKERENESFSQKGVGGCFADDGPYNDSTESSLLQDEPGIQDTQDLSKGKDP